MDLRRIRATVEPDADPPYMESPDVVFFNITILVAWRYLHA